MNPHIVCIDSRIYRLGTTVTIGRPVKSRYGVHYRASWVVASGANGDD